MRLAICVVVALLLGACADGPSPRQKYGAMYGVTGTNVLKKGDDPAPREVSLYSRESLERMQGLGAGGVRGADPNAPH